MLYQRTLTAIVLIAFSLLVLFVFPAPVFYVVSAAILLLAAWEWARLIGFKGRWTKGLYVLISALVSAVIYYYCAYVIVAMAFVAVVLLWWLLQLLMIILYPLSAFLNKNRVVSSVAGMFVLVPCYLCVVWLYRMSPLTVLLLFIIVWGSDTSAYLVGRAWGKRKLIARVSPGKTWLGFFAAIACSVVLAIIYYSFAKPSHFSLEKICLAFAVTAIAAMVGDLQESMLKRISGVKDSGKLFPGHGGLLDRIDSLTAAAPVFFFAIAMSHFYAEFLVFFLGLLKLYIPKQHLAKHLQFHGLRHHFFK